MKALGGLILAAAVLVFMFAGEQMGPGDFGGPQGQPAGGMRHKVIFDDPDEIEGKREAPHIDEINVTRARKHPNLIKYRTNFNEKVLQSVNAL
jgi:hypothetical protein